MLNLDSKCAQYWQKASIHELYIYAVPPPCSGIAGDPAGPGPGLPSLAAAVTRPAVPARRRVVTRIQVLAAGGAGSLRLPVPPHCHGLTGAIMMHGHRRPARGDRDRSRVPVAGPPGGGTAPAAP